MTRTLNTTAGLPGPSRRIEREPSQPLTPPQPLPDTAPEREPAAPEPERKPEKVPA